MQLWEQTSTSTGGLRFAIILLSCTVSATDSRSFGSGNGGNQLHAERIPFPETQPLKSATRRLV